MLDIVKIRFKIPFYSRITAKNKAQLREHRGLVLVSRYATILLDISDESKEDFDELLLERNKAGRYWLHFAVRPSGNRRKVRMI